MLVKNGFMIATVWAESIPTWAAASNALILELKQGDQVWKMSKEGIESKIRIEPILKS